MKIVFMGTPPLAAESVGAVVAAGHDVVACYTKERRPVGRKQIVTATPVANKAEELGIECVEPRNMRDGTELARLKEYAPDIIVVVAYGKILPKEIIELPRYGTINLHVSLLPKYRGAAPIQRALMNGDSKSGVTIMQIDEGLDTGDIISTASFDIALTDNAGDIFKKMEQVGIPLLLKTIEDIEKGTAVYTVQNDEEATLAPPIVKTELACDLAMDAEKIHNIARGVYPFMMAPIKLCDTICGICESEPSPQGGKTGEVLSLKPLIVACGKGSLILKAIQPQGKKMMEGTAFAAGKRLKIGDNIFTA